MTASEDLIRWFRQGKAEGATHMIVVCDTFDWSDYPVYVLSGEDVRQKASGFGTNMQKVMEVYDLRKDMKEQMQPGMRVFNY